MHACGHDTHVAMLLGAATIFSKMRAELPGTVVLFFQPAGRQRQRGAVGRVRDGQLPA